MEARNASASSSIEVASTDSVPLLRRLLAILSMAVFVSSRLTRLNRCTTLQQTVAFRAEVIIGVPRR